MKEIYSDQCLYKDTYTIINMMDENMRNKINYKFIEFLKENQDINYNSCIDSRKTLKNQKLREEIKLMLSIIYINYLCDPTEKDKILELEEKNIQEYNKNIYDNLFKKKEEPITQLVVVTEKNIIQKIIAKIKKIFKR